MATAKRKKFNPVRTVISLLTFIITVLSINLVSTYVGVLVADYRRNYDPYKATWIGMLIQALILVPAYRQLNKMVTWLLDVYLRAGKNLAGRRLGLFVAFGLLIFALYGAYLYIWFGINFFKKIQQLF